MSTVTRRALMAPTLLAIGSTLASQAGHAQGFIEDSSARLDLRNIYFNRDFREDPGQSKRDEWAQGFLLDVESGFTQGIVGFGLDAQALLGIKLDSSPDRTGTGLLPRDSDNRAEDDFSTLGLTAKARASQSEIFVGTLFPKLPTLQPNSSRILPQTFEGAMALIGEIDSLALSVGHLQSVRYRDSSGSDDLALNNKNRRFGGAFNANHFEWAGADYQFSPGLAGSFHLAQLDDLYRQQFLGLTGEQPLGEGVLVGELRVAFSEEQGSALAGNIDNQAWQGRVSYARAGHILTSTLQKMRGDTAFPYINGSNPYLVNFVQINDFAEAGQRSIQLRYDYDFEANGVPGLTFMTRYVRGDQGRPQAGGEAREWERDSEVMYVVQAGSLKNLGIRWRNASYRSSFARDADENRLILSYSLPIW